MAHNAQIASLLRKISSVAGSPNKEEVAATETVATLSELAEEHGIAQKELEKGYELALSGQLATSQAYSLLAALLPREPLSIKPVLLTVSSLGESSQNRPLYAGKIEYKVQRRALEQLAVLLELGAVEKEGREALDRLYGVGERGLEYKNLRDVTAQVLCQITRRHHVQPHRIASLQSLIRRVESPPPSLLRLLEHYHDFRPEHVYQSRSVKRERKNAALEEWKEKVAMILGRDEEDGAGREAKRRKTTHQSYIPLPATYSTDLAGQAPLPLSDITSLTSLGSRIDTVALPSQAASGLSAVPGHSTSTGVLSEEERSRAWALILRCGYDLGSQQVLRLSDWLIAQLRHELFDLEPSAAGRARIEDLLCRARELSEMGGELLEPLEPFLAEFLRHWDGQDYKEVVFDLIASLKPLEFESLYGYYLKQLERLAEGASPEWVAVMIGSLEALVSHLAARDDWTENASLVTAFGQLDSGSTQRYLNSLQSTLNFADSIISSATQRFPSSLVLRTAAFSFYSTTLSLPLEHGLPVIVFPSSTFTYTSILAGDMMSVSRISGLISKLREALTGANSAISKEDPENSPLIAELNARLVDFVNCLWQKKFLVPIAAGEATDLSGDDLDAVRAVAERREQASSTSQALTQHAALAPCAREFYEKLADAESKSAFLLVGPVTASSIKRISKDHSAPTVTFNDFRPLFLERLRDEGAEGLYDFLFSSLQSLINRRVSAGGGGLGGTGSMSGS
ncbi:hypothetical protein JCM8547_000102 [Rhodosporidiobolus lusitaniae]